MTIDDSELTLDTVDLRSDTVTGPSPAMREAIFSSQPGDDAYGDDRIVNALEEACADLFGKPAALFTSSGTMSNQLALCCLTEPGDEVITEHRYHVNYYESAATVQNASVVLHAVTTSDAILRKDDLTAAIVAKPRGHLYSQPRLLALENTIGAVGGRVFPWNDLRDVTEAAREQGMRVHLDGARLPHAQASTGVAFGDYGRLCDTISMCFAKGLGGPFGSILVGDRKVIDSARIARKRLGGGLHQAGMLAAAAQVALESMDRIGRDHELARRLLDRLQDDPALGVASDQVETNMVLIDVRRTGLDADAFVRQAARRGLGLSVWTDGMVRAVCHRDVSSAAVDRAADILIGLARDLRTNGALRAIA